MKNNIYFVVETAIKENNRSIKPMIPDSDGVFTGVPLMVMGEMVTQNNTKYEDTSVLNSMTNPNYTFHKRLTAGDLFGEHGHPRIYDLKKEDGVQRILTLDPDKKCIYYKKIYNKQISDLNANLVFGDIKPCGPYGKYAEEMLIDPNMNFSTSLRALSSNKYNPATKVSERTIVNLITFDCCVPGGGFREASKRYANISSENLCELISPESLLNLQKDSSVAFESLLTNTEINDILKLSQVSIKGKISGYYLNNEKVFYDSKTMQKKSILSVLL